MSGNAQLTGITTGTFVGDGSGLTGVTAVGQGVVIKDSGTLVGVAQSINLDRNLDVTQAFGGNVTVSAADTVGFAFTSGSLLHQDMQTYLECLPHQEQLDLLTQQHWHTVQTSPQSLVL